MDDGLKFVLWGVVLLFGYFLPSLIAAGRHTANQNGVFLANLLLGWTVVGWGIALIIACATAPGEAKPRGSLFGMDDPNVTLWAKKPMTVEQKLKKMETLEAAHAKGIITAAEFERERAKLAA